MIVYFICMDSFYNMLYIIFVVLGLGMSFVKYIIKLMKCLFGIFVQWWNYVKFDVSCVCVVFGDSNYIWVIFKIGDIVFDLI